MYTLTNVTHTHTQHTPHTPPTHTHTHTPPYTRPFYIYLLMVFELVEERGNRGRVGVHRKNVFVKLSDAVLVKFLKLKK